MSEVDQYELEPDKESLGAKDCTCILGSDTENLSLFPTWNDFVRLKILPALRVLRQSNHVLPKTTEYLSG